MQLSEVMMRQMSSWRENLRAKKASSDDGKMLYLESIRGLAALAVVWAHILATYFPSATVGPGLVPVRSHHILITLFYGLPFGFSASGHFAVVLFFTLSGFVLTYKYFQTQRMAELQKQAAKRYFRLAIPVFCTVILAYVLISSGAMASTAKVAVLTGSPEAGRIFAFVPTFWSALYDATIGVLVNGNAQYNPVLWTMSIEFIGSFVIFGFVALTGKLRYRWLFYAAALIFLNHSYYACFIIGAILADAITNTTLISWLRARAHPIYAYAALVGVVVLASFPYPDQGAYGARFHMLAIPGMDPVQAFQIWHFIAAAILLLIILVRREIQNVLNMRPLVFIGGISFALYLTHYLILHSLGDSLFVAMSTHVGVGRAAAVAVVATVTVTLVVSIFWKKYVDDMSVKVSRKMAHILLTEKKKEQDAETEIVGVPSEAASSPSIAG